MCSGVIIECRSPRDAYAWLLSMVAQWLFVRRWRNGRSTYTISIASQWLSVSQIYELQKDAKRSTAP